MDELKILIADDHELVRRGVRDVLSTRAGWQVVGEACNGADAVAKATSLRPDVAILDFSMPEMNGAEAATRILKEVPEMAIVVLTMHESDEVIHDVLRSGARGLVLKTDADRTLLAAVEAAVARRHFFTERASELVLGVYLTGAAGAAPESKRAARELTAREHEIMLLLADGMTSREAAGRLQISPRTVESHRIQINRKLGFGSIADLVRYVIRTGMVSHG